MGDSLTVAARLVSASIRAQMQYRLSFLAETGANFLGLLAEFAAIVVLFGHVEALAGWSLWEVAFLYGTAEVGLSLGRLLCAGFDQLPETIRLGQFDQILTRPRSALLQVLTSHVSMRHIGRAGQGALVLAVAVAQLQPAWNVADWLFLGVTLLGGAMFFSGLFVAGASAAFWTVETLEIVNIFTYGGAAMASYPLDIYGRWMQRVFVFLVPLAFMNFYPALHLLDKGDPFGLPAAAPFVSLPVCALVLTAGLRLWGFGVKRYQSTGQ